MRRRRRPRPSVRRLVRRAARCHPARMRALRPASEVGLRQPGPGSAMNQDSGSRPPYSLLPPQDQQWRPSNMMKIPNTNLAETLGSEKLGARLWRLPPFSANTWHRHAEQDELYFVLEGTGRIRV